MYKCPICGASYETEAAVVKCVNECGRRKAADGAFKKKEIPTTTSITYVGDSGHIQSMVLNFLKNWGGGIGNNG